jgi:predicted GIY-YIG superfamily endonuclease
MGCNIAGPFCAGKWYVYFLKSVGTKRTYVGMSNDVPRRLRQHNGELVGGAKYTKSGRPWELVMVFGPYDDRSEGCKVEWRAKRFRGQERFKYRKWVAELDNLSEDIDKHLQYKRKRRRKRK